MILFLLGVIVGGAVWSLVAPFWELVGVAVRFRLNKRADARAFSDGYRCGREGRPVEEWERSA